jgi:hypothetical protein
MRSKIDQANHIPYIFIYNTETKSLTEIFLPVLLFEKVMNLEEVEKEKQVNRELELFIEQLISSDEFGLNYKDNLSNYMKINNIPILIQTIIGEGVRNANK